MRLPNLARDAAWNYSSTLLEGLVGVFLVGFIIRSIGLAHYGIFVLALSLAEVLMLLDGGLLGVLSQQLVKDRATGASATSTRLTTSAFAAMVLTGAAALASAAGLSLLVMRDGAFDIRHADIPIAATATLGAGVIALLALPASVLMKVAESHEQFALLGRLRLSLAIARSIGVVAVLSAGWGVTALIAVQVADAAARLVILGLLARRLLPPASTGGAFDWPRLRAVWRPGKWALAENVANYGSYGLDSFILGWRVSIGEAAIFAAGRRIPYQLWQLVQRVTSVTLPPLSRHFALENDALASQTFVTSCRVFLTPMLVVSIGLSMEATAIMRGWLGADYPGAAAVLRWLMLTTVFQTIAVPAINLLYSREGIALSARIALAAGTANVALTVLLARPFGAPGAAAATAIVHGTATLFFLFPCSARAVGASPAEVGKRLLRDAAAPLLVVISAAAVLGFASDYMTLGPRVLLTALMTAAGLVLWGAQTGQTLLRAAAPGGAPPPRSIHT